MLLLLRNYLAIAVCAVIFRIHSKRQHTESYYLPSRTITGHILFVLFHILFFLLLLISVYFHPKNLLSVSVIFMLKYYVYCPKIH